MKQNNKQYYFVTYYDSDTGKWEHDVETEQAMFGNRLIWNNDTSEFECGYLGDGKFEENEEEVSELFNKMLNYGNNPEFLIDTRSF
jgi:hypothetical protein